MSLVYVGSLSVGGSIPGASAAITAGLSGITAVLPGLIEQLATLAAFTPAPINFAAQLALAESMVVSVNAAITAGLPVPDISAQIAVILATIAALTAQVAGLQANLAVITDLAAPLAASGLHAYAYDGATDLLGPALTSELAGGVPGGAGGDHANALVLITTIGATWDAMELVFKVSP